MEYLGRRNKEILNKLNALSKEGKQFFIENYLILLAKWKKEFKLSVFDLALYLFSKLVKKYCLGDYNSILNRSENSIKERERLKKFAESKAEIELLDTWADLDRSVIEQSGIVGKIETLRENYQTGVNNFREESSFENAVSLLSCQFELLPLYDRLNDSVFRKSECQERLKRLSQEYDSAKSMNSELLAMGIITDLLSRNEKFVGTAAALSYSTLKKYRAQFRNTILLTNRMKKEVESANKKLRVIRNDLTGLINNVCLFKTRYRNS